MSYNIINYNDYFNPTDLIYDVYLNSESFLDSFIQFLNVNDTDFQFNINIDNQTIYYDLIKKFPFFWINNSHNNNSNISNIYYNYNKLSNIPWF